MGDTHISDIFMSEEELKEEIAFQKIILSSIDDSVANQEDAKAEVVLEIKALEAKLRNLTCGKKKTTHSTTRHPDPFGDDPFANSTQPGSSLNRRVSSHSQHSSDDDALLQSQVKRQLEAAKRLQQEKEDAEFAMRLQSEDTAAPTLPTPSRPQPQSSNTPSNVPNALHRLMGRPPKMEPNDNKMAFSASRLDGPPVPGAFPHNHESDSDVEVIEPDMFSPSARTAKRGSSSVEQGQNSRSLGSPPSIAPNSAFTKFVIAQFGSLRKGLPKKSAQEIQDMLARIWTSMPPKARAPYELKAAQDKVPSSNSGQVAMPSPYSQHARPGFLQNGLPPSQRLGNGLNVYGNLASGFGDLTAMPGPSALGGMAVDPSVDMVGLFDDHDQPPITPYGPYGAQTDFRPADEQLTEMLKNISNDTEIPPESRLQTPAELKTSLYEHQKLALTWLHQMEAGSNKGGILADDMGLGKTISTLALLHSRPSRDRACKTTLIVGPVALIKQWDREIEQKTKSRYKLTRFTYHGGHKASFDDLRTYDVVLTTYGTLASEYTRYLTRMENTGIKDVRATEVRDKSDFPFLGNLSKFYRIVLDEAQYIKNKKTKAAKAVSLLKATYRFCLTGTPMMNGVHELSSLMHFLRIRPYSEFAKFDEAFGVLRSHNQDWAKDKALKRLQTVLKAIMLRRTKTSQIDGKPILSLPPKTEETVYAFFDEEESNFYTALKDKALIKINKYIRAGTVGKNYQNMLVLLLRLRQAACHPHLIMDFDEVESDASPEDMIEMAKQLTPDVVKRIMEAAGVFECPVCYDAVENPSFVIPCGHDTCSECLVQLTNQAEEQAIAQGEAGNGGYAKCAICRGKITPGKVIDYLAFKKCHMADSGSDSSDSDETDEAEEVDEDDIRSNSGSETLSEDDNGADLKGFIVGDDEIDTQIERDASDDDDDLDFPPLRQLPRSASNKIKNEDSSEDLPSLNLLSSGRKNKGKGKASSQNDDIYEDEEPVEAGITQASSARAAKRKRGRVDTDDDVGAPSTKPKPKRKRTSNAKGKGKGKQDSRKKKKRNKNKKPDSGDESTESELEIGHDDTERTIESHIRKPRKARAKKPKKPQKPTVVNLASMKKDAQKNAANKKIYFEYLTDNYISSAKTNKCIEILQATAPDVKTIIFSQFTTFLDLLEVPIELGFGPCHRRYDGSMTVTARNQAVLDFTDDPQIKIMLVSLKAGNAGLNLTAASQVIIMDPFWNPYIEMQAVDRAYRIGQMKPVKVFRIIVQNTVEDGILTIQDRKRELINAALDEKASRGLARLGQQELLSLFKGDDDRRRVVNRVDALSNILGTHHGIGGSNVYAGGHSSPQSQDD